MSKGETNEDSLPTLGEASCLVLGLIPNQKNRGRAKTAIEEAKIIDVSYKRSGDPFEPFIVSKKLKTLNPFLYKSYNVTPPQSPVSSLNDEETIILADDDSSDHDRDLVISEKNRVRIVKEVIANKGSRYSSEKGQTRSAPTEAEDENIVNISTRQPPKFPANKKTVMTFLKSVVLFEKPDYVHQYTFMWTTTENLLEIVKSRFFANLLTTELLEKWLDDDGFLGKKATKFMLGEGPKIGRYLYIKKPKFRADIPLVKGP